MSSSTPLRSPQSVENTPKSQSKGIISDLLAGKTPGVKNIEEISSRAGASNHHTPDTASKPGSQEQVGREEGQRIGSRKFGEGFREQRSESSAVGKIFNNNVMTGADHRK